MIYNQQLNHLIKFQVNNALLEALFDPHVLSTIPWRNPNKDELGDYIANNTDLPDLGQGSSRNVFELEDEDRVLKVAKNPQGLAQNEAEVDVFTNPKVKAWTTEIFDYDRDFKWIVSEKVTELKTNQEWEELVGFPFEILEYMIDMEFETLERLADYLQERFDNSGDPDLLELKSHALSSMVQQWYNKFLYFVRITKLAPQDLAVVDHWGFTQDGRVVLLDYGLTTKVQYDHY